MDAVFELSLRPDFLRRGTTLENACPSRAFLAILQVTRNFDASRVPRQRLAGGEGIWLERLIAEDVVPARLR